MEMYLQDNHTHLHAAAWNGHTPVVELLIKLGARIEALTKVNYIYLDILIKPLHSYLI